MIYVNNKSMAFTETLIWVNRQLQEDQIKQKELELEGIKLNRSEDMYTVLEMHVNLDLEGLRRC